MEQDSRLPVVIEVVKLMALFDCLDEIHSDLLSKEDYARLEEFRHLIFPVQHDELRFANNVMASAMHIIRYLDLDSSTVAGTTYRDLWFLVKQVDDGGYFHQIGQAAASAGNRVQVMNANPEFDHQQLSYVAQNLTCCRICHHLYSSVDHCSAHEHRHFPAFSQTDSISSCFEINTTQKQYRCSVCAKSFFNCARLVRHLQHHRKCKSVSILAKASLQRAVTASLLTDNKLKFGCSVCGKIFKYRTLFNLHALKHIEDNVQDTHFEQRHSGLGQNIIATSVHRRKKGKINSLFRQVSVDDGSIVHVCRTCGKEFTTHANVLRHARKHTGERPFPCGKCGKAFWDASNRAKHEQWHVPYSQRPACTGCGTRFLSERCLSRHINGGFEKRRCTVCGARHSWCTFSIESVIVEPQDKPDGLLNDDSGSSHFSLADATLEKLEELVPPVLPSLSNETIEKAAKIRSNAARKIQLSAMASADQHSDEKAGSRHEDEQLNGIGRHRCPECGKLLATKSNLERHFRLHTGDRPFECEVCGKDYSDISNLKKHMQIHTTKPLSNCDPSDRSISDLVVSDLNEDTVATFADLKTEPLLDGSSECMQTDPGKSVICERGQAKPLKFECPVCSKRFPYKSHMDDHMRVHTDIRPYQCETCGKVFKRTGDLLTHSRYHDEQKQFECTECGRRFTWKNGLERHRRVHTGERPFLCTTCGRAFADWSSYKHHIQTHPENSDGHRPPERFPCAMCGKTFAYKRGLARHMRIHSAVRTF